MSATAKLSRTNRAGRSLREWSASAPTGSPLRVDREAGVIYGVKVLGFRSRNSHGLREATAGTEYTRRCMEEALPLYEGVDVLVDHDDAPGAPRKRSARAGDPRLFGALREARVGDDGIRADLHFFRDHELASRVCEDVERGLGRFGLSHDASAKRERFDPASRRLVIESLAIVRSVDLVRKPASNRNLWESQDVSTTLREQLEARLPKWKKGNRAKWANRLLEDDTMAPAMDAPAETEEGGSEEDALWSGFVQACMTILNGDGDAAAKGKKITAYLKAHEKLTQEAEPEAPADDEPADPPADPDKTEAVKVKALEHKIAVRDLADELGVKGDKVLLEAAEALALPAARKLLEREKARGGQPRSSGFTPGGGTGGAKGKAPADSKEFANSIRE
jgi:SOS response regulatory protein OraA/RecX